MEKIHKKPYLIILLILIFCAFIFSPGFSTYFHQDDFIMFYYSQNISRVLKAFNIFAHADFPFYRPIPTQLYFFVGRQLFGFRPMAYHVINFLLFSLNTFLVYRFIKHLSKSHRIGLMAVIFFALNTTHFAPLFAAAYAHELFFVLFGILTIDNFLRQRRRAIFYFILALMAKETAVVLPGISALAYVFYAPQFSGKKMIRILIPYAVILFIYLYAHFVFYGIPESSSYKFMLGKQTVNALIWYLAWSLSAPNIFIDFLESGFRIRPVFYEVAGLNGYVFVIFFPQLILFLFLACCLAVKKHGKTMMFGFIWFVIGLIPILIFPLHKLAIEQAFSLVGLSLTLSVLVARAPRLLRILIVMLYLVIFINSDLLAQKTHWIVRSAGQANRVVSYIKQKYPKINDQTVLYFKNGEVRIPQYGSSRQLYYALGEGKGLPIILGKPSLKSYFEDMGGLPGNINRTHVIDINSSDLLGY